MSGGLPHPEDTTDDPPEMAELRLQVSNVQDSIVP